MNFSVERKGEFNEVNLEIFTKYSPARQLYYKLLIHSSENINQFIQVNQDPQSGNYWLIINKKPCTPESTVILQREYSQLYRFINNYTSLSYCPKLVPIPIIPRQIVNAILELEII